MSRGGYHPPKNRMTVSELIKIIFAYSARKNKPNDIEEYSVKKPATNVASSSGRSKGNRLVSAKAEIIKTINIGKRGMANHKSFWLSTMSIRLSEPTHINTVMITKPIDTS
jgi:hypothetical protein